MILAVVVQGGGSGRCNQVDNACSCTVVDNTAEAVASTRAYARGEVSHLVGARGCCLDLAQY